MVAGFGPAFGDLGRSDGCPSDGGHLVQVVGRSDPAAGTIGPFWADRFGQSGKLSTLQVMADLRTAEQCYRTAARLLATADGTLQDRLLAAYLYQGVRAYPPDTTGPEIVDGMLAERMRELHYALTVEDGDRYRCSIEVSVAAMHEADAEALAHELVEIAAELAYLVGRIDQAHVASTGDDAADPAGGAASTGGSVAAFSLSKGLGGSPFARYPHAV